MINTGKKKVLFICTHNSARSQIAEGLLRALHGDRYDVYSAGTQPTTVHPYAITVMQEIGIDISLHEAKSIEQVKGTPFNWVVTVCDQAQESCPFFPGAQHMIHKSFQDPAHHNGSPTQILAKFRRVRDEISEWIEETFQGMTS